MSDVAKVDTAGTVTGQIVTERMTEHAPDVHIWTPVQEFDEFVELCGCDRPHLNLLTDPELFSTTQRGGRMGPVTLQDVVLDADTSIDCGDVCSTYRVFLVRSGRAAGKHQGLPAGGGAGSAAVYAPEGLSGLQWDAGTEILLFKMARHAVEDALGDALGRQLASQPRLRTPAAMPTNAEDGMPDWRCRSTTWLKACSARSPNSRNSATCCAGSPPTSATNCAPR